MQVFDFERWAAHRSSQRYFQHLTGIPKVCMIKVNMLLHKLICLDPPDTTHHAAVHDHQRAEGATAVCVLLFFLCSHVGII